MLQVESIKYPQTDDFYEGMVQWLEMERELSESDINEMEREQLSSLTSENLIVSKVALNNKDYDNTDIGA